MPVKRKPYYIRSMILIQIYGLAFIGDYNNWSYMWLCG